VGTLSVNAAAAPVLAFRKASRRAISSGASESRLPASIAVNAVRKSRFFASMTGSSASALGPEMHAAIHGFDVSTRQIIL
jgi:hypothetical protein